MGLKVVEVAIDRSLITEMLTTGYTTGDLSITCQDGLPDGAELIDVSIDDFGKVRLFFRHDSFDEVEHGNYAPSLRPTFRSDRIGE